MTERRGENLNESAKAGPVLVISPHDDDGGVGCGGFIAELTEPPTVVITSDGRPAYHTLGERGGFVERREREATSAYAFAPMEELGTLRYDEERVALVRAFDVP